MSNLIFYFSGTGNSLAVAREIAKVVGDMEVVSIPDHFGADLSGYERIGFVYPVYFAGVPLVVERFVDSLDLSVAQASYLFGIATCGGSARNGVAELNVLLSKKGHGLDFGALLNMGGNYILLYGKPEKADAANAQTAKELPGIATAIRDKVKRSCGKPNPVMSLFTRIFKRNVHKAALKYTVSAECASCGLCAQVCPVRNIEIKDSKPAFGEKCEQCMACLQWCPKAAINYKGKTQSRKRYHHPDISYQDLTRK
jgi:ferredoxin